MKIIVLSLICVACIIGWLANNIALKAIPFSLFSNVTVGNIAFSAYCCDDSFVGREPIAAEAIYEFSKNLRFTEMQSK